MATSAVDAARELREARPCDGLASLFEGAESVAMIGSWEWFPRSGYRCWSDNLYRLLGYHPGEVSPTRGLLLERIHPDDRRRATRYGKAVRSMSNPPPFEFRIQHPTDGVRHMRSTIAVLESDDRGSTRVVGVLQDVTDEQVRQREIAAHLALAGTLAVWEDFEIGAADVLHELGTALEFVFGVLWLPRNEVLVPAVMWSDVRLELGAIESATSALQLTPGIALPGRAWRSKQPEILADIGQDELVTRRHAASRVGLRGAVAFPALHSGELVAVLEFYHREDAERVQRLTRTMAALGFELGEFLSHRRGQLGTQRLTERQLCVLSLAAAGRTTQQIAAELGLSRSTVRTHFDHVYEKFGVADRTAAVAQAMRLGLIR